MPKSEVVWTSGGRKTSGARIKLSKGKGLFVINDLLFEEYYPLEVDRTLLCEPLVIVGLEAKDFDISLKVRGGGKKSQRDACRHALARALEKYDPELRKQLKSAGFLTRDARMVERKKYGLRKARRAPQFSKR
ncbi:30S ribosomal protein S9 [Patescibacteria group bacterium]|nr:30S ribosomal protein S9 [Patescibacteria group bacterium]MBU1868690.1 30S ribosomal protein S9 [Patescibacteria group bacterium]